MKTCRSYPAITSLILLTIAAGFSVALSGCGQAADGSAQISSTPTTTMTAEQPTAPPDDGLAPLEPASGTYFGVNLDWSNDSAASFNERLGKQAAVYVQFVRFPLLEEEQLYLNDFFEQVAEQQGIALLTLEPTITLNEVTPDVANSFAGYLSDVEKEHDVSIMVRFAHEMNGSWYSWSQQPEEYIAAFRTLANAVHAAAPNTAILWAPNYGDGYPFSGGAYAATPGSSAFALLDTNKDGQLDPSDDPYTPYYPGDDVVDWVGISLYHWGSAWPWGENEIPEANKFSDQLTGNYNGSNGDGRDVPDFYGIFGEQHGKPVAIVETAALYNPQLGGASALEIKQAWWNQVYEAGIRERFPQIKMINWFEWDKFETEINGRIDWTLTKDPETLNAFLQDFDSESYIFAPLP